MEPFPRKKFVSLLTEFWLCDLLTNFQSGSDFLVACFSQDTDTISRNKSC